MLKYQSDGVTGLNQPKQTLSQVSSISLDPTIHAQVRIILQVVQLLRIKQATYYLRVVVTCHLPTSTGTKHE